MCALSKQTDSENVLALFCSMLWKKRRREQEKMKRCERQRHRAKENRTHLSMGPIHFLWNNQCFIPIYCINSCPLFKKMRGKVQENMDVDVGWQKCDHD